MNRSSDEDDRESKIVETVFEQNKKFLSISEIFTDLGQRTQIMMGLHERLIALFFIRTNETNNRIIMMNV